MLLLKQVPSSLPNSSRSRLGTDILFVPYKGGGLAITDVLGGHIDMVFNNKSTLLTLIKEGKLKALAVTSAPLLALGARYADSGGSRELSDFQRKSGSDCLLGQALSTAIVHKLNHAVNEGLMSGGRCARAWQPFEAMEAKAGNCVGFGCGSPYQAHDWKTVVEATGIKVE